MNTQKRKSKAAKFNEAFDVGKELAEILSHASSVDYENKLKACQEFVDKMRNNEIVNVVDKPGNNGAVENTKSPQINARQPIPTDIVNVLESSQKYVDLTKNNEGLEK